MALPEPDLDFLRLRKRLVRWWPMAAYALLSVLALCLVGLVYNSPYLANPFFVAKQLGSGLIESPTLAISAVLLPVVVLLLFLVVAIFIILGFALFANEKRYLKIIDALLNEDEP